MFRFSKLQFKFIWGVTPTVPLQRRGRTSLPVLETSFLPYIYSQTVYTPLFFLPVLSLNHKVPSPRLCFFSEYNSREQSQPLFTQVCWVYWEEVPKGAGPGAGAAQGRDIKAGFDQSQSAAEGGWLHSNPPLPKLVCSAFSYNHVCPLSGLHSSLDISIWSYAVDMASSVRQALRQADLPFALPNQAEFLRLECNSKGLLGISSATLIFRLPRIFYLLF